MEHKPGVKAVQGVGGGGYFAFCVVYFEVQTLHISSWLEGIWGNTSFPLIVHDTIILFFKNNNAGVSHILARKKKKIIQW